MINHDNYTEVLWKKVYDAKKRIKSFLKKYPEFEYADELNKKFSRITKRYTNAENAGKRSGVDSGITYQGDTKLDGRVLRKLCSSLIGKTKGVMLVSLEETNMKMEVSKQMYKEIQHQERAESDKFFLFCINKLLPEKEYVDIVIEG